jgi:hypothetical protein
MLSSKQTKTGEGTEHFSLFLACKIAQEKSLGGNAPRAMSMLQ